MHNFKYNHGVSIIEINIILLIIGVFVIILGSSYLLLSKSAVTVFELSKATTLANGLMEEMKALKWDELDSGVSAYLGTDTGETADKTTFDDIDDYNNYIESPPLYPDGTILAGFDKYSRQVTVNYVDSDLAITANTTTRKTISIEVIRSSSCIYRIDTIISQK